jgi:hypothetical protein
MVRETIDKKTILTIESQKNTSREAMQKKQRVKEKLLDASAAS